MTENITSIKRNFQIFPAKTKIFCVGIIKLKKAQNNLAIFSKENENEKEL